jgi:transposase InsO family protein
VDLFSIGDNNYLIYADRYSGWPTVSAWMGKRPTSRDVIGVLKKFFFDFGIPVRLRFDGGGHFTSAAIDAFLKQWGVSHVFSTPHYPQSNGHA